MGSLAKPRLIVAGASGFVGKALAPLLAERFHVVGLSRSERDGGDGFAEYRRCDLFSLKQAEQALADGEYAVYLVHNMMPSAKLTQGSFADLDLVCADNFARAAARAGIKQIVFLGGLCPSGGSLSKHLESRVEVERVLAGHGVPVTTLRAGLILGGAGSSFQIMTRLVHRLPMMVCPRWTNTRTQAVALRDVVQLLDYVVGRPDSYARVYDVSAPDVVTYREMMQITAEALEKRRFFLPSRFLSPGLSRLWVSLVTGAPRALVAPLVQSLKHEMVAQNSTLADEAGLIRTSTREAIALAIAAQDGGVPHAFRGPSGSDSQRLVRSVQRMRLPEGWTAEHAALEYLRWLPRYLSFLIRVRSDDSDGFSFVLLPFGLTLLTLKRSPARSSADRQLFFVAGGVLAKPNNRARFELRQVLGGRTLLTMVHDYEPRLPWVLYVCTQALFHQWLMHRFAVHLSCGPRQKNTDSPIPVQGPIGPTGREARM
ncbi:MAG: NAD(P)H-binding protein [Polyangiales bacterium]